MCYCVECITSVIFPIVYLDKEQENNFHDRAYPLVSPGALLAEVVLSAHLTWDCLSAVDAPK